MKWHEKLQLMMTVRGMQQLTLARRTEIHQPTMSLFERGLQEPNDAQRSRIEAALEWDEEAIRLMRKLRNY